MSYEEILKSFEERGIMNYVRIYRELKEKIERKIGELREVPQEIVNEFDELKERAISSASLIKKGDAHFVREISYVIGRLEELDRRIDSIAGRTVVMVKKYLERLEELRRKGEISEDVYERLKKEYLSKLTTEDR